MRTIDFELKTLHGELTRVELGEEAVVIHTIKHGYRIYISTPATQRHMAGRLRFDIALDDKGRVVEILPGESAKTLSDVIGTIETYWEKDKGEVERERVLRP